MNFFSDAIRVFAGCCLLAAGLFAAPKGNYALIDQGQAAGQSFSLLGTLTLDGAGNVKGVEVFRSEGVTITADVTGTFVMASANSGTMSIAARQQEASEPLEFVQNYRFLVTDDNELYAVRTDAGVLSTSFLLQTNPTEAKVSLALNELNRDIARGQSVATLAQIAFDGNGAVSGKGWIVRAGGITEAAVSGAYSTPASGLGTLTLVLSYVDDNGDTQDLTYHYRTASTRDGVRAIRLDPGVVAVANIEVQ